MTSRDNPLAHALPDLSRVWLQRTIWLGSIDFTKPAMLAIQLCTESAQPVQRGSFMRSHAMMVGSDLYVRPLTGRHRQGGGECVAWHVGGHDHAGIYICCCI